MRRLIARWLGIRYMDTFVAIVLINNYFDAVWNAAQQHAEGKAIPEETIADMHKSHNQILTALTRGV